MNQAIASTITLASKMLASIVITTKNRRNELSEAIRSAVSQSAPVEVLVMDDGSTDGTADMVLSKFPSVKLERSESSRGYIVQRNRAARLARGEIIFSIDDDAIFTSPRTVAQTLAEFDHPRVGVVAIPYIEPHKSGVVHQQAPRSGETFITDSFTGTAHALRKDVFLRLGGYREHFVHQGEEGDYSIRMFQSGYLVRLGRADPIHHMESPRRDFRRMRFYARRNDILFAWHNVPMPYLPLHLIGTTLNGLIWAFRSGQPYDMLRGTLQGHIECVRQWKHHDPVSSSVYWLSRRLKKHGPKPLEKLQKLLPPVAST